jgi:tyrosine-protein kinase Etk/Wzc
MTTTPQPAAAAADAANVPTDSPWLESNAAFSGGTKLSLFDTLVVLAQQRRLIVKTMLVCGVLGVALSYLAPKMYESYVTFLPPAQTSTRGMTSVGDISSALSAAAGTSFKSAEDFWTSVLKGRTITDRVINMFDLKKEYHVTAMSQAEGALRSHVTFDIDKAGLISIYVKDKDPQRAAQLANGYVAAMHAAMSDMAEDDANQRMAFFNSQVDQERGQLADAEKEMTEVQRRTGVIALGGQTSEAISQIGDLRARITEKTVQLQALRASATDLNPDVQKLRTEIGADESALSRLENEQGKPAIGDISATSVPQATLDYIRAARELRYHESLYDALGKQVEAARLDIARSAPMIQVVDVAVPADHRSGVGRIVWLLAGMVVGFFLGLGFGVARYFYRQMKATPEGAAKLNELAAALRGRA